MERSNMRRAVRERWGMGEEAGKMEVTGEETEEMSQTEDGET